MLRYEAKVINGDWYVVDSVNGDRVKRCRSSAEARDEALHYNAKADGEMRFLLAFGV